MSLPSPRDPSAPYRIAIVCLGNICRSPMAAVVLAAKVADSPLAGRVIVNSAGTGDWHVGDRMDSRAAATLAALGYDPESHRARHFDRSWFAEHDLVVAMDRSNLRDITGLAPADDRMRIVLFREFDPQSDGDEDVPDPWYGRQDSFDAVLSIVDRGTDELLRRLASTLR